MDTLPLEAAVRASFIGELEAFKPGNVSHHAGGHDMTAQDFINSAEVSTPVLCQKGFGVGRRILESVKITGATVGCNTNLGMLLLFSPIIVAAETGFDDENQLHQRLRACLDSLTSEDTSLIYEAIRLANPGGLGEVKTHDVRNSPDCSIMEAMQLASDKDFVALQYYNGFTEIFNQGLTTIKCFVKRWNSVKWATVSCYLMFLSTWDDSHIYRKYGSDIAGQIKIKSKGIADKFNTVSNPESCIDILQGFDKELKANRYNPGTSADLTAASLLVYNLINMEL